MTIPTAITLSRLLMALSIMAVFQVVERPLADWIAAGIFALASVGDFLDGFLARRLHMESELGRVLDPIADKVLVAISLLAIVAHSGSELSAFVPFANDQNSACESMSFCARGEVPIGYIVIPAAIILFRELLVSGLRERLAHGNGLLSVTWPAKWKSAFQMVGLLVLLAAGGLSVSTSDSHFTAEDMIAMPALLGTAGIAMIWFACLLTLATGADYMAKAIRILQGG